jgi:hypothetical protein
MHDAIMFSGKFGNDNRAHGKTWCIRRRDRHKRKLDDAFGWRRDRCSKGAVCELIYQIRREVLT